ncbi:hypothetical protein VNO78_30817 [Psophocarpus tetragonolobus]|uniref:1-phosphatidylinositol-4-phosphate 5-kinase n=1 Tax=Psophocarpus tetragonolobus TaxID=3891 RepID=A0AAN9RY18_PSOTE
MERLIMMSFVEAVSSAIRSDTSSELGTSSPRSFASLIDSEIRSSNASVLDFIPSPSPLHSFASTIDLRTRSDVQPSFTNTFSNKIDYQEDKDDVEEQEVPVSLPNGDMYIGRHSGNVPDGSGKYVWSDGKMYEGEWKKGKECGEGRFTWPSGASYEGEFASGWMHGFGEERYPNGDVYEGWWRCSLQEGEGRYTWRNGDEYFGEWKDGVISGKGVLVWDNGNRYEGFWENGVPKGRGVFTGRDGSTFTIGSGWCESDVHFQLHKSRRGLVIHRHGNNSSYTISKGHKNYDLMLNLQLGIKYSVGKLAGLPFRELRLQDFDPKVNFWTRFPPGGSKFTPPHQSVDFRWKDYCPLVFKHLRQLFGIDLMDYLLAICGNDTLTDMSIGKTGSFICLAQNRFIIKTLKKSQVKVLISMLPSYYQHVCRYKNSLLTKFLGVHCVKHIGGQKTRFIVMSNVFCSDYHPIHQRYDVKGSSHGRTTNKPLDEIDETATLKYFDLHPFFRLEPSWFQEFKRQLDRDCEFLEAEGIMDYSFLIGLHFRGDSSQNEQDMKWIPIDRVHLIQLGINMPAIAERVCKNGGEVSNVILYFGIINILQDKDMDKKLEHACKSLQVDSSCISAVDPKLYSKRFRDFMGKIFVKDK